MDIKKPAKTNLLVFMQLRVLWCFDGTFVGMTELEPLNLILFHLALKPYAKCY